MFIVINSNKSSILLSTYSQKLADEIMDKNIINSIIPNAKLSISSNSHVDFQINHLKSNKNEVKLFKKRLDIRSKTDDALTGFQIGFILQAIFEKLYQETNSYGIHAAAICKNEKCILLMGDAYSGKSSLALRLCKENNFEFVGDERCIIQYNKKLRVLSGNSLLVLRKDFLSKNYSYLKLDNRTNLGNARIFVNSTDLKLKLNKKPVTINAIIRVNIGKLTKTTILSQFDSTLLLFRALTYQIRSINTPLVNFDYVLPSLDNQKLSEKRLKMSKKVSESVPTFEIHGSQKYIQNEINKIFRLL